MMIKQKTDGAQQIATVYVYYKIPSKQRAQFQQAIQAVNKAIADFMPSLDISYQRRPETDADGNELWMEIYNNVPHDNIKSFSTTLEKLVADHQLPKERRFEIFIPL